MVMRKLYALLLVLTLAAPAAVASQDRPKPPAAGQDGFVPVEAPTNGQDAMPAPRLVALAYGFIWVVLFGYLWSVRSRLDRVGREMEAVSRRVSGEKK
jgi:CcmD family protein